MATIDEQLGGKITRQRKAVGLTQAELAERVGVQPETISRIETGARAASLALIARVADALEVELHELVRFADRDEARASAIDRLLWFASRLSPGEIELLLDVGAAVVKHTRRAQE